MSGDVGEKSGKNGSFHETDSFDDPKGVPISMEPVFSTAAGVRIDVKQESIDKSKKLLNNDLKASSATKSFSSPLLSRSKGNTAFVSPFRRNEQSTSSAPKKRSASKGTGDHEAPPPKKALIDEPKRKKHKHRKRKCEKHKKKSPKKPKEEEKIEMNADVMRSSRVYENDEVRVVLQETSNSPLVLAKAPYECGRHIKFGDKVHVQGIVLKRDESNVVREIFIDKVLRNKKNGARPHISRHSIASMPFCLKPRFIHDLSDEKIKKAVLQVNILDLNLEVYDGCDNCKHLVPSTSESSKQDCKNCKDSKAKTRAMVYSRMRVMDFSGQVFVHVKTKTMEKLLDMFGFEDVEQWLVFKEPQERMNYVFQPLMIEVEKTTPNEWECTDVAEVNWIDYNKCLKEKELRSQRHLEKEEKKARKEERIARKAEKKEKKEAEKKARKEEKRNERKKERRSKH